MICQASMVRSLKVQQYISHHLTRPLNSNWDFINLCRGYLSYDVLITFGIKRDRLGFCTGRKNKRDPLKEIHHAIYKNKTNSNITPIHGSKGRAFIYFFISNMVKDNFLHHRSKVGSECTPVGILLMNEHYQTKIVRLYYFRQNCTIIV